MPLDEEDLTDEEGDAVGRVFMYVELRSPRGVAGTTVCVEVVDSEDEDEEFDGAGEKLRGDLGVLGNEVEDGMREEWDLL